MPINSRPSNNNYPWSLILFESDSRSTTQHCITISIFHSRNRHAVSQLRFIHWHLCLLLLLLLNELKMNSDPKWRFWQIRILYEPHATEFYMHLTYTHTCLVCSCFVSEWERFFFLNYKKKMVDTNMFGLKLFILICALILSELQCYAMGEYKRAQFQ